MLRRELIYLWYYFNIQLEQIFWYWILGMVIGSAVSVFAKDRIHDAFRSLGNKKNRYSGHRDFQRPWHAVTFVHVWNDSHCRFFFQKRNQG